MVQFCSQCDFETIVSRLVGANIHIVSCFSKVDRENNKKAETTQRICREVSAFNYLSDKLRSI